MMLYASYYGDTSYYIHVCSINVQYLTPSPKCSLHIWSWFNMNLLTITPDNVGSRKETIHTLDIVEKVLINEPSCFCTTMAIVYSNECPLRTRFNRTHWPRLKLALIFQCTVGLYYRHRKFPINMFPRILIPPQSINPTTRVPASAAIFTFRLDRRLPTGGYNFPQ